MDGRRSVRKSAVLPVAVSGTDFSGLAFKENTWTIAVNHHWRKDLDVSSIGGGGPNHSGQSPPRALGEGTGHSGGGKGTRLQNRPKPKDVWGGKTRSRIGRQVAPPVKTTKLSLQADYAAPSPDQPRIPPAQLEGAKASEGGAAPFGQSPRKHEKSSSFDPGSESAGDFLRASRIELRVLLAKAQEIQKISLQAVQALLEEVQVGLHQHVKLERAEI
jgi:hypothetical protein